VYRDVFHRRGGGASDELRFARALTVGGRVPSRMMGL
jgi:hypothetical protein